MGFFSDLKNKITGGSAEVTIDVPSVKIGEEFTVKVNLDAKDDIKVNNVYLRVQCQTKSSDFVIEKTEISNPNEPDKKTSVITAKQTTGVKSFYYVEEKIAGENTYKKGMHQITKTLTLPTDSLSSGSQGAVWSIYAGLRYVGNDPDSGWKRFEAKNNFEQKTFKWGTLNPILISGLNGKILSLRFTGSINIVMKDANTFAEYFGKMSDEELEKATNFKIQIVKLLIDFVTPKAENLNWEQQKLNLNSIDFSDFVKSKTQATYLNQGYYYDSVSIKTIEITE